MTAPRPREVIAFGVNVLVLIALVLINQQHRSPLTIVFIIIGIIVTAIWGADLIQRIFK